MKYNYATKIHQAKSLLCGEFHAGLSVIEKNGKIVTMYTWINPEVIANILFIPRL